MRLGPLSSAHHHQRAANHDERDADVWGKQFVVVGVDADMDVARIDAMALGVRQGNEKGCNS